jgi:hypothetical protein
MSLGKETLWIWECPGKRYKQTLLDKPKIEPTTSLIKRFKDQFVKYFMELKIFEPIT